MKMSELKQTAVAPIDKAEQYKVSAGAVAPEKQHKPKQ